MRGAVKWWRKELGMGRLMLESGIEAHVTRSSLAPGTTELADAQAVECEILEGPSGKMAIRVRPYQPKPERAAQRPKASGGPLVGRGPKR
ncbi:MAG: hypothetical protein U1E65_31950 [Myxococcota bacterium]